MNKVKVLKYIKRMFLYVTGCFLDKKDYVYFKVTKEEKDIIRKLAWCQKFTVDEFVRYVIFSKYIDDFIR